MRKICFVITMYYVVFSCASVAQTGANVQVDIVLHNNNIKFGEVPKFSVIIKNTSEKPFYVIDFNKRPDIQNSFFVLDFFQKDTQSFYKPFYPPRVVTNFGQISMENYTLLAAGQQLQRKMYRPQVYFEYFSPGEYGVVLHLIAFGGTEIGKPFLRGSYKSKMVFFKIG